MRPRCGHELHVILQKAGRVVPAAVQRKCASVRCVVVRSRRGSRTLHDPARSLSGCTCRGTAHKCFILVCHCASQAYSGHALSVILREACQVVRAAVQHTSILVRRVVVRSRRDHELYVTLQEAGRIEPATIQRTGISNGVQLCVPSVVMNKT